ncbi:polyprenyl synthetase family protein [Nocardia brasiliensis]|uniref:polyprenyl synthetase family protein n=1 Tax=Nocardia brasiliensis TaxID=37326 RepID=UPI002458D62A|nr:polyprenyl synthetase family protein [Nocardia brasiliensis]
MQVCATTIRDLDASRTTATVLVETRKLVKPGYFAALDRLVPPLRQIVDHHIGRHFGTACPNAADVYFASALVLAAAEAAGAGDSAQCIAEAIAIESVHDFLRLRRLFHSESQTERRSAAWTISSPVAIRQASDALLAVAIAELADRPSLPVLARAVARLPVGRATAATLEPGRPAELAESLRMTERTTATLLSCACEMGAAAVGADASQRILFAQFGRHLDLVCRLSDDVLGLRGSPDAAGGRSWVEREADKQWSTALRCLTGLPENAQTENLRLLCAYARNGRRPEDNPIDRNDRQEP